MFDKYIELIKNEIISSTCSLIKIPSIHENLIKSNMPFGKECNDALEYVLNLGKKLGFRTKNVDGYCGYVEFGEGEELMGIIGHLDVVPAGENWTYPPFSATISDDKIYGRGAIDDKGPVIAALYAMKAVMDNCTIHKRVRLILGLNEERDWKCIEYYKQHEEIPDFGFSPDADFPCIYAEKALLNIHLTEEYNSSDKIRIISINCRNNAINIVPKFCEVELFVDSSINIDTCIHNLNTIVNQNNYSIEVSKTDNNHINIKSYGTSAHAAHPDLGKNAISPIIIILNNLFKLYTINVPLLSFFTNYINLQYNGKYLGIYCLDESGELTLNVAQFSLENDKLKISMNLRIPVHTQLDTIKTKMNKLCENTSITINYNGKKDALYIPKDNELVQTLCNIYSNVTGEKYEPIAIGGATYARAFPNCVSFGANMPGDEDMCHKIDEFISIDNLILSANIYAKAIYELCK